MKANLIPLPQCPVCKKENRVLKYEIQDSKVFECKTCQLKYLDPCLAPDAMEQAYESHETLSQFHDFHEGYYEYGNLSEKSQTRTEFERGLQLLERHLGFAPGKKILDVGFGNGFFLALAKQRGWQVDGDDTSAVNATNAKRKYGLILHTGKLGNLNVPEGSYDAISFWDVIEHFSAPHVPLAQAGKLLKEGGYLLIGVPHDRSFLMYLASLLYLLSGSKVSVGVRKIYFLEHVAYYFKKPLESLMNQNGFQLKGIFYSSTDLRKYKLPFAEKLIAGCILAFGKLFGAENRMVAIFQKTL